NLTEGIHLHRIGCKDRQTFDIIKEKLVALGIGL
ncbi:MAG: 3H domain-containing protein, partial [Anaerovoracaceae bacterium]